jgi:cobalt-zinc-cadmium efflux system outer membrane protein
LALEKECVRLERWPSHGLGDSKELNLNFEKTMAMTAVVAVLCFPFRLRAEDDRPCASRVTRTNLVRCALAASLSVRGENQELEAARARQTAVSALLPSNPVLELSAATRSGAFGDATNWYATLRQEVEIAGQRGVRRDAEGALVGARLHQILSLRREVAAQAWVAFFDVLAATEEQRLAERLAVMSQALSTAAGARAEQGLIAPMDADVADAMTLEVLQAKWAADRRVMQTNAALASLLGLATPAVGVDGELTPVAGVAEALTSYSTRSVDERPELLVLSAEARAQELRADGFRRSRIPNPVLSVFAQNDGANERVFGAGVAFPIPLPGNVGRTFVGEIAEAEALARRAATARSQLERDILLEVTTAVRTFESRATEVLAFPTTRTARAEESLAHLAHEIEAGRLAVRDAVVAQRAFIDLLRGSVEARRAWCVSSVNLARALGMPLEGSER